jgi:uncharacterized protein YjdB
MRKKLFYLLFIFCVAANLSHAQCTVSGGSDVAICIGSSTTLTATGASTYTWSPSDGLSCTGCVSPTASPTVTTTYTVTGTTPATIDFMYTGGVQYYTVPPGVTSVAVDMSGGSGGEAYNCCTSQPVTSGGRVQCNLAVTAGQVLYVYVGQAGQNWTSSIMTSGGYNGGGGGGSFAASGGGASDIRTSVSDLTSRLVVAGGGGGGGDFNYAGGPGGGLTGGTGALGAGGGTQTGPGTGGYVNGAFGIGGTGNQYSIGGGGGGYWGGNAGVYADGGGGGGSSYTDPVLATSVIHTQGYSGANGNGIVSITGLGCSGTAMVTVTVNPLPDAGTIGGFVTRVCAGSSIPLSGGTPGGVWSSGATTTATVGSTGVVSGVSAGTATISYSVTTGCGTAVATQMVTVFPLPVAAAITGASAVCAGSTLPLTDATAGGAWSSTVTSVATIDASGLVSAISAGTSIISYSYINSCGTYAAVQTITVNPLPDAGAITGASAVCAGSMSPLTDANAGGAWSSSSTGTATVSGGGVVTGVVAGTATISYSVTNGCGTAVATDMFTVNPLPVPGGITGPSSVCPGSAIPLTDAISGGAWSSASTGTATVDGSGNVTGVAAGTALISYAVTNGCGTLAATDIITVNPLPSAGTITGSSSVCATANTPLTDASAGGVWSSGATSVAVVDGVGLVTGVAAGTAAITYTVTNVCGTISTMQTITVNPLPVSGSITGIDTVCVLATTSLTDAAAGGIWSSGTTGIATVGSAGSVAGIAAGTAMITYAVTNGCGTAYARQMVMVNPLPFAGVITGATPACAGSFIRLADLAPGGVWSSSANATASVDTTGMVTGVKAGNATISYTVTNSCGTVFATEAVTINPLPSAGTITGPTSLCLDSTIKLSDAAAGGFWSSQQGGTVVNGTTGSATGAFLGNDTIMYQVTNGCGTARTFYPIVVKHCSTTDVPVLVTSPAELTVYPNPNEGTFTVNGSIGDAQSGGDTEVSLEVTNMLGQVVYSSKVTAINGNLNQRIVLGNKMAPGMYLLSVRSAVSGNVFHIVVEK